jgi:hypothetical protein
MAVGALATGCSLASDTEDKASGKGDDVASVTDPSGKGEAKDKGGSSGGGEAGKDAPQLRLDTTEEEKLAMFQPYLSCMKSNGVPIEKAGGNPDDPLAKEKAVNNGGFVGDPSQLWYSGVDETEYPKALKACGGKRPRQPQELDPKTNPHFMDDFRKQIQCMNDRGVKVDGLPDGSGWNYRGESTLSSAEVTRIDRQCQVEAFGGKG